MMLKEKALNTLNVLSNLKDGLSAFLQFTTGSKAIVCEIIGVTFTSLDGLARRPIAHTCTPVELPTTYKSYELSEEFTSISKRKEFMGI